MNLLNLAPEIQAAILALEPVQAGRDQVTARQLRVLSENDRVGAKWKRVSRVSPLNNTHGSRG
jgi:hypothetical protein